MVLSSRSRLLNRKPRSPKGRQTGRRQFFRPAIESLEERVLPDRDFWNAAISGNWTDGSKWSLNAPPGMNDTAVIDASGSNYTVTLDTSPTIAAFTLNSVNATFSASGRTITVNGPALLQAGTALLDNAVWAGSGTLTNNLSNLTIRQSFT